MNPIISYRNAELTAPTAELRSAFAEMRREIEIMRRREEIREAELARLTAEMEEAGRLQHQLLTGPLPEIRSGELLAFTLPAGRVSGDFHIARRTGAARVALIVCDATGHGLAAGLLSAAVMGSMPAEAGAEDSVPADPAEELTRLNRHLLSFALEDCEFVTAIYAEYNEAGRTFRWSRAGSPPPILLCRGEKARRLDSPGMPLGVEEEASFSCAEVQLKPGDTVVLHTDGLESLHAQCTASRDEQDFLQWIERLRKKDLISSLREAADRYARKGQTSGERDDVTLLMLTVGE